MLRASQIKPQRAKYTKTVGKTRRRSESEYLDDMSDYEKDIIDKIELNKVKAKSSTGGKIARKVLEEAKKAGKSKHPLLDAIIDSEIVDDGLGLAQNLAHGRRTKSSGLILGATTAGVGIGAGIGFFAIPFLGPYLGAAVGGALGALGGVAVTMATTLFFKKQGENLAKKWFPEEYRYDLDKKQTRNFKKNLGVPEHVMQLVHGYLQNRMKTVESDYMQDRIAILRKLAIEKQEPEAMPDLIGFLGYELRDIKSTYKARLDEYNEFLESTLLDNQSEEFKDDVEARQKELYNLQEDYILVRYMLREFESAKVGGKKTFNIPDSLSNVLKETVPSIRPPSKQKKAKSQFPNIHSSQLSALQDQLNRSATPSKKTDIVTPTSRTKSVFSPRNDEQNLVVASVLSEPLGEESLLLYDNQVKKMAQEEFGNELEVEVLNTNQRQYRYDSQTPPITFTQKEAAQGARCELSLALPEMEVKQIRHTMNKVLRQIDLLLKQDPDAANEAEIEIEPDAGLSSKMRVEGALYLIGGLNQRGVAYKLMGYTNKELQEIQNRLADDPPKFNVHVNRKAKKQKQVRKKNK